MLILLDIMSNLVKDVFVIFERTFEPTVPCPFLVCYSRLLVAPIIAHIFVLPQVD